MTTDMITPDVEATLAAVASDAVQAWATAAGLDIEAATPVVGGDADVDPDAAVAVAAQLSGTVQGALVVVVPADAVPDAEAALEGIVAAAADALGRAAGGPVGVEGSGIVAAAEVLTAGGQHVAIEIAGAQGSYLMHWLLEPTLVARIGDGPVASPGSPSVAPASYPDLTSQPPASASLRELSVLADVQMEVSVELGRTQLRVRDLLALVEGSIIDLDRTADAEVSVFVNGTLIAKGDVVVVDEELGVRITEVVARP